MKKSVFSVLLIALLLISTACGNEIETPTTTTQTTTTQSSQIETTTTSESELQEPTESDTTQTPLSTDMAETTGSTTAATTARTTTKPTAATNANTTKTTTAATTTAAPQVDPAQYEAEALRLINAKRADRGLAPLTVGSDAAMQAADVRAAEILTEFSHTRPDGSTCFTALTEAGIAYSHAGENIAWGQRTPAEVVNGWMHSQGHRENILDSNFTHLAVGFNNYAWVQLFYRGR